jgi:ubiquinol-cytochrome c reductase cytochrome c subunit
MRSILLVLASLAWTPALAQGNTDKGNAAYVQHGCWQCHGYAGQGGVGPKLAPGPMPLAAMNVFVRNTNRAMPPYQKEILSDGDLADIHAYLQSIPAGKDYKSIPLLNQ